MLQPIRSNLTSHSRTVEKRSVNNIKDRSEITGGGGGGEGTIYVGRVIIFSNKVLGGSLFFLPKLREGHNFFNAKPADLN